MIAPVSSTTWEPGFECQVCEAPADWTDEPPRNSATANDWWCSAHAPPLSLLWPGWERVRLVRK